MDRCERFASELPWLEGGLYFNHAAVSPLPKSVVEAMEEAVRLEAVVPVSPTAKRRWADIREETRRLVAEFIGAAGRNIAFVQSTSAALSIVALALPWQKGDNVVTASVENPANINPWQNLAHLGVEVRYLPADRDDLIDISGLTSLIDSKTRLVALSLVNYATGQRVSLKKVADLCRPEGILTVIDGVQGVGAVPCDVSCGINFLAFGFQKWMMGPKNIAALYADDAALEQLRSPIVTEGNVADIRKEEEERTSGIPLMREHDGALKLEAVPFNHFAGIFGVRKVLSIFNGFGKERIWQRVREVTDTLVASLSNLPGRVVSPRNDEEWSGIVSFDTGAASAWDVARTLREKKIHVAVRKGRVRISPHFYVGAKEIRRFAAELASAVAAAGNG